MVIQSITALLQRFLFFLHPNRIKLSALGVALAISFLLFANREYTTKVTWLERRGSPMPFLVLGGCSPAFFCSLTVGAFHIVALLVDVVVWYLVICLVAVGYKKVLSIRLAKRDKSR